MNPVSNYLAMRNIGLNPTLCAEASGIDRLMKSVKVGLAWIVVLAGLLYLLSDKANAIEANSQTNALAIIAKQEAYIKSLEKIVSLCFDDKEQPVLVGNEWHLCRAVPTGITQ